MKFCFLSESPGRLLFSATFRRICDDSLRNFNVQRQKPDSDLLSFKSVILVTSLGRCFSFDASTTDVKHTFKLKLNRTRSSSTLPLYGHFCKKTIIVFVWTLGFNYNSLSSNFEIHIAKTNSTHCVCKYRKNLHRGVRTTESLLRLIHLRSKVRSNRIEQIAVLQREH